MLLKMRQNSLYYHGYGDEMLPKAFVVDGLLLRFAKF